MQGTYDESANAVYLRLVEEFGVGESKKQSVVEAEGLEAMVVLDSDDDGYLLGVEILGARRVLRGETLAALERIG